MATRRGCRPTLRAYAAIDPFVNIADGRAVRLHDLVDPAEFRASTYYREWLVPIGVEYALGLDVREPGRFHARLRLCRDLAAGNFTSSDCRFIESLEPHLRLAVSLYSDLDEARSGRELYADAMDSLTLATVVLDEHGRVIHSNRLAENVLRERDGLSLGNGRLVLSGRDDGRRFRELVERAAEQFDSDRPAVAQAMRVTRPSGRPAYELVVRPSQPGSPGEDGRLNARVAVLIGSAIAEHPRPELSVDAVRQLFGLTPKEAALALRLARGRSLEAGRAGPEHQSQYRARAPARDLREDRRRPPESAGGGVAEERRDAGTITRCTTTRATLTPSRCSDDAISSDAGRVGMIELFFDLVFVFAVTQLSHTLVADLSLSTHAAGQPAAARGLVGLDLHLLGDQLARPGTHPGACLPAGAAGRRAGDVGIDPACVRRARSLLRRALCVHAGRPDDLLPVGRAKWPGRSCCGTSSASWSGSARPPPSGSPVRTAEGLVAFRSLARRARDRVRGTVVLLRRARARPLEHRRLERARRTHG